MEIPATIKVWAHELEVSKEESPTWSMPGGALQTLLGKALYDDNKIVLKDGMLPSKEVETLLHELLHFIAYYSNSFKGLDEHEERVVDQTANGLTLLFKDNPLLLDYIKESLHD